MLKETGWSIQAFNGLFAWTTFEALMSLGLNLMFGVLYYLNLPFFERYKVLEEPWPWQEDPEAFWKLVKKTAKLYFFNIYAQKPTSAALHLFPFNGSKYWPALPPLCWKTPPHL